MTHARTPKYRALLRRPVGLDAERCLSGREAGDRHAKRAARYIIQPDLLAERDRGGVAAMLTTNTELQRVLGLPTLCRRDADHLADALYVDRDKRVLRQNPSLNVLRQELAGIITRQAEHGLRQVVGAEAEEIGDFGDLVGKQRGAGQLDHRPDAVFDLRAGFREDLGGDLVDLGSRDLQL